MPDRPPILPLNTQWFTPDTIADALGVSRFTVYRCHNELVSRDKMKRHRKCIWDREEATVLAVFIQATARPRKKSHRNATGVQRAADCP